MCDGLRLVVRRSGLFRLLVPALLLSAPLAAARAEPPRVEEVIIVFKTHFDIGYTDMAAKVVQRYRTSMIDAALAVVDQNRGLPAEQQFVWTIPGWPMHKMLEDWPGQRAERQQRIREAFKNGRFVVHALPFTTHTELLELEDLVRGLTFASKLSREAGLPLPRDAKMTDVPCHSWAMATLLRHAGVNFLHLGSNAANSSPEVPPLFWWEGPDGSRLLTMYSAGGYGTGLVPPRDWPYRAWLALIHTGDNYGPPRPEEVQKLLDEAARKLPGVKIRIGRLSDFADAVLVNKPDIPVVRGDMPDTWIHGPMSDPIGAFQARVTRPKIAAAEALNTELRLWGVDVPDASGEIAAAYEQSLLYGEHTWGGALAWLKPDWAYGQTWLRNRAEGKYKHSEESWQEHSAYIQNAWRHAIPVLREGHAALARNVKAEGGRIVVFNPLPWKRSGIALVDLPASVKVRGLRPIDDPAPVPSSGRDNIDRFLVKDLPALGYRTYVPCDPAPAPPSAINREELTIENPFFKVKLDPKCGGVASLIDKRSGRELVDASNEYRLGQYLYERFDRTQTEGFVKSYTKIDAEWVRTEFGKPGLPAPSEAPYRAVSPSGFSVSFREDPITICATLSAPPDDAIRCPVMLEVTLPRELPYVELAVYLQNKPADPWPEAGWMCLPFKVNAPRFRLGRQGSIVDPVKDIVPGSNRHLLALNTGMTITDPQGEGVGLCPYSSWLVSLDTPGCWRYSKHFPPRKPVVFVNLFNNQWSTNFRLWNEGNVMSGVRLWAVDSENTEPGLITPSLEKLHTFPLMGGWFDGPAGTLPTVQAGVELSRKGILVTAFGKNPDGEGLVLRLWELAGTSGPCRVRLPAGMSAQGVQPVNLRGEPEGKPVAVSDGAFTIDVGAFAPASARIPFAGGGRLQGLQPSLQALGTMYLPCYT